MPPPSAPPRRLNQVILAGLALALCAPPVLAGEGDLLRPVLQYSYVQDDNLFRLADTAVPFAQGRSDRAHTLGAGLELDWRQGRQQVRASLLASRVRYDRYTLLDYDGRDAALQWLWQLGNRWQGVLGTDYRVFQGTFLDTGVLTANVRTQRRHNLRASYAFHSNWDAELRHARDRQDFDAPAQANSAYLQDETTLGVFRRGGQIERLGVELARLEGRYPNRVGPILATRYDTDTLRLVADWVPTGKTRVRARLAQVSRQDNAAQRREFSGLNARLDGSWVAGGKTLLNLTVFRDLRGSELAGSDSVQVTGVQGGLQWQALPKIVLGANLSRENYRYQGGANLDEHLTGLGLSATWQPRTGVDIGLNLSRQQRDSSANHRDFDATVLALSATGRF